MKTNLLVTTFLATLAFNAFPSFAADGLTKTQKEDLKTLIRTHLVENPDIIEEAILALQAKKQSEKQASAQKAIQENLDPLFKNDTDPVLGNTTGQQSIVAFLDPFCGHCRSFKKVLTQAIDNNQDLKVIIKDFPILGNVAVLGTKAMLAAHQQGFYSQMQNMIYKAAPSLNKNEVLTLAKTIDGLDLDKFTQDFESKEIEKQLEQTYQLAQKIGIGATPTLIIGTKMVEGGMPLKALEDLVNETKSTSAKN